MIGSVSSTVSTTDSFARTSCCANNANKKYQNHGHSLKVAGEGLQLCSTDPPVLKLVSAFTEDMKIIHLMTGKRFSTTTTKRT